MKSIISLRSIISILLLAGSVLSAKSCGPYFPIIPTPKFFCLSGETEFRPNSEREENLLLWQSLTSRRIPQEDIEEAVYKESQELFHRHVFNDNYTTNKFYLYLRNTDDLESIFFWPLPRIWRKSGGMRVLHGIILLADPMMQQQEITMI